MVGIPGILSPPAMRPYREPFPSLAPETASRLERVLASMAELATPLASVNNRAELERLFDRTGPEYLHLRNQIGRLVMDQLSPEAFLRFATAGYEDLLAHIKGDTRVLGAEERELLVDVVESLQELLQSVLEAPEETEGIFLDVLMECSVPLQRVDMCVLAIALVLVGETSRWNPRSVRLLCQVAQECMGSVEDIFLLHNPELQERLKTREETLSLTEVETRLGLRG